MLMLKIFFLIQISDLRDQISEAESEIRIRSQLSVYIFFTGERNILRRHFITQNYATFLQRTKVRGGIPDFVKAEFESYLKCGILAHGFLRIPFIKIWKKFEGEYREKAFEVLCIQSISRESILWRQLRCVYLDNTPGQLPHHKEFTRCI